MRRSQAESPGRGAGTRAGFTLIELVTVILVAGTLARIAVPNLDVLLERSRASQILEEVRVIQEAVRAFEANIGTLPQQAPPGEIPPGFVDYLPTDFRFERDGYTLSWQRWSLPDGLPGHSEIASLAGVTVTLDDEEVGAALLELVGSRGGVLTVGPSYTFILPPDS